MRSRPGRRGTPGSRCPRTRCHWSPGVDPALRSSTTAGATRRSGGSPRSRPGSAAVPGAGDASSFRDRVDLWPQHADEPQIPIQVAKIEPIADDELIRDREAGVVHGNLDEPPGRLVEQRADAEGRRVLAAKVAHEVVEREPGVDDVLHDQDILALDAGRKVLEDPDETRGLGS